MKELIVKVDDSGTYHIEGELIRCEECVKNKTAMCAMARWWYTDNKPFYKEIWNRSNDYCSNAERRNDE